jgi:hypothetical protein
MITNRVQISARCDEKQACYKLWLVARGSMPDFCYSAGSLFLLHNYLRSFPFAGAKDDGLMRGRLIRRGAAALSVAMEVELALPKFGPKQSACGRGHNHQGNHCLPVRIHNFNIGGVMALAICFSNDPLPD